MNRISSYNRFVRHVVDGGRRWECSPSLQRGSCTGPRSIERVAGVLAIVVLGLVAWTNSAPAEDVGSAELSLDGVLRVRSLPAAAKAKIDPRILFAMAQPRESEENLKLAGKNIQVYGSTAEELVFPVLIKSELTDVELAQLGAKRNSRAGDIVTAWVDELDFGRLASDPRVQAIEASYAMDNFLDQSLPEVGARLINQPPNGFTGEGVLFGLLDDGIDITHDDFKDPGGGSRILAIWDHQFEGTGTPPAGFTYGHEYSRADIDAGRASAFVNEGGHGSHVAGIAVGDGSAGNSGGIYQGIAWEADIIAVRNGGCDLFCYGDGAPWVVPFGSTGTVESVDALNYFAQKARSLGRPIVINQSQGVTMGPHDGTTLLEQAYNQVIAQNDLIVVVAAGNDQTAGWHAVVNVGANQSATIIANHHGTGGAQNYLSFELWWDPEDTFAITITAPGGASQTIPLDTSGLNDPLPGFDVGADQVFAYTTQNYVSNGQGNAWFYVQSQIQQPPAPVTTGNWSIRVQSQSGSAGPVHFYAERNQYGFSVASASLDGILGMPGTANEVITVASYNTRFTWPSINGPNGSSDSNPLGGISSFSSNGPRRGVSGGVADKPDLAAPGMFIASAWAAGHEADRGTIINDEEHLILAGTSMAAPHVAGTVALMLDKNPALTRTQVKQILIDTAEDGGAGWRKTFGYGKLRTKLAVDAVTGGGGGNCDHPGDANLDALVNVLDVVATVNHILGLQTLSGDGQECADLDGTSGIGIGDLSAIVSRIMTAGLPRPVLQAAAESPEAIAWGEDVEGNRYRFLLDPDGLGAFTLSFVPPRGYELVGEPRLLGARAEAALGWSEAAGLYKVVAYDPLGRGLAEGREPVQFEVELVPTWDGGQSLADLRVSSLELSDPFGRKRILAAEPTLGGAGVAPGTGSFSARSFPNPMDEVTRIRYELPASGEIDVDVYDAAGRRVRRLTSGYQVGGPHTLNWDGRGDDGAQVADGVYFIRLQSKDGEDSQKILVVR